MSFQLFTKSCVKCGGIVFGPREGGKARGKWLGYDECHNCRASQSQSIRVMREALEKIAAWETAPEAEQGNKLAYSVWAQLTGIARSALGASGE